MTMILFMLLCNALPWRWFCIPAVVYASWGLLGLAGINDIVWIMVFGEWLSGKTPKQVEVKPQEVPQLQVEPLNWLEVYCKNEEKIYVDR